LGGDEEGGGKTEERGQLLRRGERRGGSQSVRSEITFVGDHRTGGMPPKARISGEEGVQLWGASPKGGKVVEKECGLKVRFKTAKEKLRFKLCQKKRRREKEKKNYYPRREGGKTET